MRFNLKVAVAILLIAGSVGVVGFNIHYFSRGAVDADMDESFLSPFEDGPAGGMEGVDPGKETLPERGMERKSDDPPLGAQWKDTPWNQLVNSYMNKANRFDDKADEKESILRPLFSNGADGAGESFKEALDRLELRGVMLGKERSFALINGWLFKEGDAVPGADLTVAKIGREQVLFRLGNSGATAVKRLEPIGARRRETISRAEKEGNEANDQGAIDPDQP